MGFRQDKRERLEWKKWLQRNRDLLVECGLPAEMYEERRNWQYFLGHASVCDPTGWHWFTLDSLSPKQLSRLYDFLQRECAHSSDDPDALVVLKRMLGLPQRWQPPNEE